MSPFASNLCHDYSYKQQQACLGSIVSMWYMGLSHAHQSSKGTKVLWHAQVQVEMADAALWLYGIAFEELQRHIAVECRERAQVLGCLWDHCCCLTELRCAVQYEALLAQSRKGFEGLADQRQYLKGQIRSAVTMPKQRMYCGSVQHIPEGLDRVCSMNFL